MVLRCSDQKNAFEQATTAEELRNTYAQIYGNMNDAIVVVWNAEDYIDRILERVRQAMRQDPHEERPIYFRNEFPDLSFTQYEKLETMMEERGFKLLTKNFGICTPTI